jgi:argininosuccinate lyase
MGKNLYRSGLKSPLDNKALKFISSLKEDFWIVEEDIVGTEVHDIMLYEQNIIDKKEIQKILATLENIKEQVLNNNIEVGSEFEDIHPYIEKYVIDSIGIEIGGKIHTGRSRNDQISVDLRLKIREELNIISKDIFTLFEILLTLSEENINTFMPLYTHLQRGQVGVFSHYINNYLSQILRSLERIEEVYNRVNKNPLGACAIGGTNVNINRLRTSELLGFNGIVYNSIDAVSSKDFIYETLMVLSLLAIQFSRIAEDLIIWSTKEFDFIELDDKFCSVSSVMPQKKNPDVVELIRSRCSKTVSNLFSSAMIIKSIPSGYFRDFQDLKIILKNSFDITKSIIQMFSGLFSTIKIKRDKMKKAIEESFIQALDLAELLVQEYHIPFRQSHKIVAELVSSSEELDQIFNREEIEALISNTTKKEIKISEELLQSLKDYKFCLEKRISQGSPSEKEVKIYLEELKNNKELLHLAFENRLERILKAKELREVRIKELIA